MCYPSGDEDDNRGQIVQNACKAIFFLVSVCLLPIALAQDTRENVNKETSKPMIRGGVVYKTYCVLCHGEHGDGSTPAAKLEQSPDLATQPRPHEYYEKIIRKGGHRMGMSASMPAWQYDLSDEQI